MTKHLKKLSVLAAAACCGLIVGSAHFSRAEDPKMGDKMGDKAPPAMDQKAMMDAMMKAAAPGPEHEKMKTEVGDWNAVVKMMQPDGSWSKASEGVVHMDMMMDRYITMNFKGTMDMGMGPMPFEGFGMHGFDNATHKYWSIWVDSMSTGILKTEGTMEGDKVVLTGDMMDPSTNKMSKVKEVVGHPDATHSTYEMYASMPDGSEMKMMDIQYTKK